MSQMPTPVENVDNSRPVPSIGRRIACGSLAALIAWCIGGTTINLIANFHGYPGNFWGPQGPGWMIPTAAVVFMSPVAGGLCGAIHRWWLRIGLMLIPCCAATAYTHIGGGGERLMALVLTTTAASGIIGALTGGLIVRRLFTRVSKSK